MSDIEDPLDDVGGDDLFGDDSLPGSPLEERERILSDAVLDDEKIPENDENDYDGHRGYSDDDDDVPRSQQQAATKQRLIMDKVLHRHRMPKTKDQTLGLLRVPNFLRFIPEEYKPDSFEPSEADITNARNNYTYETVRWMKNPNGGRPLSNAALYRWSDGSVTLGVGNEHYDLQKKGLAPTPDQQYSETNDAHMYAATGEVASNLLVMFAHLTEQLTVLPTGSQKDDALSQLAERMAKAAQSRQKEMVVKVTGSDNPELLRKQAEAADRELQRAQRRRENAEMRMATGAGRAGGRGPSGLSVGGLETGRGSAGRKRGAPGSARQKRRKPEYDSDDDLPQGARRQDEYERDDFVVLSDEEEEAAGEDDDDDEEEEGDFLDDEDEPPRPKRQKTSTPDSDRAERTRDTGRSRRRVLVDDDDE